MQYIDDKTRCNVNYAMTSKAPKPTEKEKQAWKKTKLIKRYLSIKE